MTDKTADPYADTPPIGLCAFSSLALRRRLTPMIGESVHVLLADRGELWTYDAEGAKRSRTRMDRALCTEEAFDTALGEFLQRVPAAAGALSDFHKILDDRARQQALHDATRAQQLRNMGGKVRS